MSHTDTETLTARSLDRLADAAEGIARDVKSTAKGRLRKVFGRANRAYDETRGVALGAVGRADDFVRDRSLMLLGIAAGTALLVGFLLRAGQRDETPGAHTDPASAGAP
jgi:ElaB/YqjD/DUF883 family membrane-anchored ribosome-binding protein